MEIWVLSLFTGPSLLELGQSYLRQSTCNELICPSNPLHCFTAQDASQLTGTQLSLSVAKLLSGSTNLFFIIPTELVQV